jgi:hypothetical protein
VRRDGVPPEGADVFRAAPDDKRPVFYFSTDGRPIACRFPTSVSSLPPRPIRVSVIHMADRPRSMTPLMPDPYRLAEAFPDYVPLMAEPAEQWVA